MRALDRENSNSSTANPRGPAMLADLAAACMVLLSAYAQWNLQRQTSGAARALLARLLLGALGTAVGLFAVKFGHAADVRDASSLALFLIGFGQVHAPAAVILLLKSQRAGRAVLTRE